MALADVEGAHIYLKDLIIAHHMASWESIQEILIRHYNRQLLHETYKVKEQFIFENHVSSLFRLEMLIMYACPKFIKILWIIYMFILSIDVVINVAHILINLNWD